MLEMRVQFQTNVMTCKLKLDCVCRLQFLLGFIAVTLLYLIVIPVRTERNIFNLSVRLSVCSSVMDAFCAYFKDNSS